MPLMSGSSKKAVGHNIAKEMSEGKPRAQSIAIALSKRRESMKRKKMWGGGDIEDEMADNDHPYNSSGEPETQGFREEEKSMSYMADGGMVPPTSYSYQGDKNYDYSPNAKFKSPSGGKKKDDPDYGTSKGGDEMAGSDSSDSSSDMSSYAFAGGPAKKREKERFESAAKMLDGGPVEEPVTINPKGIGKGGGLKGAFESGDSTYDPKTGENKFAGGNAGKGLPRHDQDAPKMAAGGLAKDPENRDAQESPYGGAGGKYHDSEGDESLPEDEEEMPHMYAGGNAALPEERNLEDDSLEDVDASFIEAFLRARKNRSAAPGR